MAADISRVVLAAVEAALRDEKPTKKKGLSTGQALAVGAALAVAGRVAVGPGGRFVRDKVQERFPDGSESEDAEDQDLDHDEDEEPEAEVDEEEPEAELDEEMPEAELDEEMRPRPPVGPSRRPARPKGDSDQEPKLAAPRRPRRPRAPIGRT
jgi:hypothetical protein